MKEKLYKQLKTVWSSTHYDSPEQTDFARQKMVEESRNGLAAMSLLTIAILLGESLLYFKFSLDDLNLYTCAILIVLSTNIFFSSRTINDPHALHLLGATLLVVSGTAFVLQAHYQQAFNPMLFTSIVLLFVVIPMMSWGLREALWVTLAIYAMLTLSTLGARYNFPVQNLWTLQFLMLSASVVSLTLVARNVLLRKHDLVSQHSLTVANDQIATLSNRDPLTGAWNRRFFDGEFKKFLETWQTDLKEIYFMLLDVDDFKAINDKCGHEFGDQVLKNVREAFSNLEAANGRFIRMGGDEFALVFTNLDPQVVAQRGVEKLRELSHDSDFQEESNVGVSIGVVSVPPQIYASYRQLYHQADRALYQAKARKGPDVPVPNVVIKAFSDSDAPRNGAMRLQTITADADVDAANTLDTGATHAQSH